MPLPASVTTVPVHIKILGEDGRPGKGRMSFVGPVALRDGTGNVIVGPPQFTAALDANGEATVSLIATDDPDISPTGWAYTVTVVTDVWRPDPFQIQIPAATVGTLELADIPPAVTPITLVTYETPVGAQAKASAAQAAAIALSAQRASNLSDLASPSAARSNLSLGTARRSPLFTPTRPGPATMITTFQAGHGWTASNAGSSNLNDTSDFQLGSQAATIVTNTSGVTATLDSPTLTAVNLTGLCPRLLIKVEGQANQALLRFFAGDTAFTNFRNWNLGQPESNPLATFVHEGEWQWVTLNWTHAAVTGTDPRAAVTRFRLSAASTAGTALTVHVGAVTFIPEQSRWPNGVVSVCFDDGRLSPFVNAKPKLDALGWAASAYPIVDRVGLASYATVAQLRQARDYSGWEMGIHASTAARHDAGLTALTPTQLEDEIAYCQDWSASNGLGNAEGIAWPLGLSDKAHEDAAAKLCGYGRGNVSTTRETWPAPIPMRIRSVAVSNSSSLPQIQGYVDEAKTNKAWLCLTFHEITTPGTATLEWPIASFSSLMDYIAAQGCAVAPMSQVLRNAGTVTT